MPASTDFVIAKSPLTVVNDAALGGGIAWTSPDNVKVDDGAVAYANSDTGYAVGTVGNAGSYDSTGTQSWSILGGTWPSGTFAPDGATFASTSLRLQAGWSLTKWLGMDRFGFTIPAGAAITGIRFDLLAINPDSGGGQNGDLAVYLTKGGGAYGENKATADYIPPYWAWKYYGGAGDLWGGAWTPEDVNAYIGAAYMAQALVATTSSIQVDSALLLVWYAQATQYLKATNFAFALPPDAVVTGIGADVGKVDLGQSNAAIDRSVRLCKGGVPVGSDKASASPWPWSGSSPSYGGPGDLWGTTWTPSDINSAGFGLAFAGACAAGPRVTAPQYAVDSVPLTVYYTQKSRIAHASNVL